ncbi:MAG: hypothetical protein K8S24_08280, partial [Candidatus Aegiribacteria sp.]|nr:hypothetical protein [Candidatus Aegiribacteria sp.]
DFVRRLDKTNICFDGPDAYDIESTHYDDTDPLIQDRILGGPHANGQSFTRLDFTEGTETLSGGNGLYGHDETSENMSQTWAFVITTPGFIQPTAISRGTWGEIKAGFSSSL